MRLTEFQKVGEMLAKEYKIQIKEGQSWSANIKKKEVFYRKEDIYNLTEEHILGLLLHEIAHIHYTDIIQIPTKNKELTHTTINMLEDISIEYIISKDYPNAGDILELTKEEILDTLVQILPKMKDTSIHEKSLLYAAARFENRGYEFGIEQYEKIGEKISKIMIKNRKNILERKHTKNLLPLAKKIVELLIKKLGEPTEAEKRMMMENNLDNEAIKERQQGITKKSIIKTLKTSQGWKGDKEISKEITFIDAIADQARKIGKQLRTILKRNNAMEFGGRFRTGKLFAKRFIRIKTVKDRNPFARRIIKSNQSYAFAIASDVSGSMFNYSPSKADAGSYALSSMYMVGEALRYAAIPRSMIIFGRNAKVVSPMGKSQITWDQLANRNSISKANQNNTNIEKAINTCTQELDKIKAERKIMIVLSDGGSDLNEMQKAHKKATNKGIECLGITIGNGYYENQMEKTFSEKKNTKIKDIKDVELIGKAFIDILKTSITKSNEKYR